MTEAAILPRQEAPRLTLSGRVASFGLRYGILLLFVLVLLLLSFFAPDLLSRENLLNVLVQNAAITIVAVGQTYVLIAQGLDISVGGNIALSSLLAVLVMTTFHQPWFVGVLVFLATAILFGFINGFSVARLGMTAFLVTLATNTIMRGLVLAINKGQSIYGLPPTIVFFGSGMVGPVPVPVVIMLLAVLIGYVVLSRSVFGRQVCAIGGNPTAASMQGLNVRRTSLLTFTVCGAFVGLAAIVLAGRYNAAIASMGTGFEFSSIAACVIGGTSLAGGEGNMAGTLLGALIIGMINNSLDLLGVSVFYQDVVRGTIIFVAVLLDALRRRLYKV